MSVTAAETPELTAADLCRLCGLLFDIAQRHTPATAFADTNELLNAAHILQSNGIEIVPLAKLRAAITDHSSALTKQSNEYRLLKARYSACLSTIADLAGKRPKKNKSAFHAGVHEGLRRAAKVAIMFLTDISENRPLLPNKLRRKNTNFVR
jgi:hypothetical protein